MDHAAATLQDVGAALAYVGQSAVDTFRVCTNLFTRGRSRGGETR